MSDDLRDRAVQLWLEKASDYTRRNESIGAVVDLVLEETAKVAEDCAKRADQYRKDCLGGKSLDFRRYADGCMGAAAAIRSLSSKGGE